MEFEPLVQRYATLKNTSARDGERIAMVRTVFLSLTVVAAIFATSATPAKAEACATTPTMQACIECGSARFGYEAQVAYCRNNWKPGRKQQSFDEYRKTHPKCSSDGVCPIKKSISQFRRF